ncbi:helix-turn-helix domain-containing protein [Xanthomonas fragariae]|uniref:helix-turn-helix domain-containing protein n=1 Tax=Xanthomonas fragariae TaxID=48664 RepID=UPI001ABE56E0|nr:helix-turn-helix transcriptional regulator [Xanthomonas fragariae]UKR53561.1 helix-turn-helix domain-containing protein [Xanthomonas fragariae]WAT16065.1 helix-turn-helix transcriptional regulator [Xanthomonas fragariae]
MSIEIEVSSGNIYSDLGYSNAEEMKIKAALAGKISAFIADAHLTQAQAAAHMGISQAKVSEMLRGRFRGISEAKMMECLKSFGQNVTISVTPAEVPDEAEISVAA